MPGGSGDNYSERDIPGALRIRSDCPQSEVKDSVRDAFPSVVKMLPSHTEGITQGVLIGEMNAISLHFASAVVIFW